ncbi:MAG: anthrone oxygenase family protein [Actinomycetota bacterium]
MTWRTAALVFVVTNAAVYVFLAVAIVPYWQTLDGIEIQDWFADQFGRFSWMMVPVHLAAIVTTVVAFRRRRSSSGLWLVALIGLLASQTFNFTIYAVGLNPDLSSQELSAADALDTLDTWGALHLVRTALVVVAALALAAITATESTSDDAE